ncbi:YhfX family PLP-dependent enzyme [Fictibacillus sp. JL2B1089]|uniref:YhfX family PLP-dependent enzyme n=1 Tax=Fictibacillus sp. JL2B1089 TaxID=3399565 RepID=UPI003A890E94
MFLQMTIKRNPALIRTATRLHQEGLIPPNTYVIDLDSLSSNVQSLKKTAKEHDICLYYMTKQIGRSGFIGNFIEKNGIEKAVAVDIDEANNLIDNRCKIGNVGHLVQPGKHQWKRVLTELQPEVITLFSFERAVQLSREAAKLGNKQDVILRVVGEDDLIYPGQFGGIPLCDLESVAKEIQALPGIHITGLTNFPIMQLNTSHLEYEFTPNLHTLLKGREIFDNLGIKVKQLNAPSSTSCHTIPLLRKYGITHGEPGHAITGTTPLHAYDEKQKEVPSMVYVSEVSHMDENNGYTIAGGYYSRSNMENAIYGNNETILGKSTPIQNISNENIDYYGCLKRQKDMQVGDTAIYAFRAQIFVTRAHIAFVEGVDSLSPKVVYFQRRGM